jgi:hypothetical protein
MRRLREDPIALAELSASVAKMTRIPLEHVIKDFWVTESLRIMAEVAKSQEVHIVFKGGTSLSKAYKLISRFSDDIDLLCIAEGGDTAVHSAMRRLHQAVANQLGAEQQVIANKSTKGEFRPVEYEYPGQVLMDGQAPGMIRVELSTWGGSIPSEIATLRSLIAEHAPAAGLMGTYQENDDFEIMVLRPERTLIEKLVILHDAAVTADNHRLRKTARHYYDIWCLLGHEDLQRSLTRKSVALLANEVYKHNTASKSRATQRRPNGGFATSPAFTGDGPEAARDEYSRHVLSRLIWPDHPQPTFDDCLARILQYASIL